MVLLTNCQPQVRQHPWKGFDKVEIDIDIDIDIDIEIDIDIDKTNHPGELAIDELWSDHVLIIVSPLSDMYSNTGIIPRLMPS